MNIIDVQQGSPQWAAHRATHFNASEAAAMLGVCPYKTRDQLLTEKKTGVIPVVDNYTQRRFDQGHRFEKLARPLAEKLIGDELFPCVGVLEKTLLSASFDGLTLDQTLVFEHKTLSQTLRESMQSGAELPLHYRVQLEQQLLVSGASKVLFMASNWDESDNVLEQYQRDYFPDRELRKKIIHGWQQFEKDLANYAVKTEPEPATEISELPELPPLQFQASGQLTLVSNLAGFKQKALTVLDGINRTLISENDFATAEQHIKWCKTGEDQLATALDRLIIQTADFNYIFSTIKTIQGRLRDLRLDLNKQVTAEKARIKQELIDSAIEQVKSHYQAAHVDYVEGDLLVHTLESAIKGLKNLDKMQNAMDRVVVAEKTALTQRLESGELTRLMSVDEINHAIAPLSISEKGLLQCGFMSTALRAADFPKLIRYFIAHLSTAQLPESTCQAA